MKLTVGIPTYNRPDSLLKRIDEVEKRLDAISMLVICDNTPQPDQRVLDRVDSLPWIKYCRNSTNIGGGANFLRVIENATGDYLWWRGDDDPVTDLQINSLLPHLDNELRLILLSPDAPVAFDGIGVRSFADNFSNIRSMGWFSMIVLPLAKAKKALPHGYWGIYTGWANVCLLLGLFRVDTETRYRVVPFLMKEGDFREEGRNAMWWAFFETCLRKFPLTAQVIADPSVQMLYLQRWRETQRFRLVGTMIRLRLGLTKQETISYKTLASLVHWKSPRTTLLFFILYFIAKIPVRVLQFAFAAYSVNISAEKLRSLEIAFLIDKPHLIDRYRLIKEHSIQEKVGGFL